MSQKKNLPTFTITIKRVKAIEPITGKIVTNDWDQVVAAVCRMLRDDAYYSNPVTTFIKVVCDRGETYASSFSGLRRTYFSALHKEKGLTLRRFFGNAIRIVVQMYDWVNCHFADIGRARFRWFPPDRDKYWLEVNQHAAAFLVRQNTKWEKGISYRPDRIIVIYPFSRYVFDSVFPDIPAAGFSGKSTEEKLIKVLFLRPLYAG
ncbi:MAG: hypothetical protein WCL23_02095 [Candidatus Moraniibacteriota bacterium]